MLQKSYHTKTSDIISKFIESKVEQGFTAGELSEYLRNNGVDVNKTTVYRNLDRMTNNGQLIKHKSMISDGFVYQAVKADIDCDDHIHFHCCKCGVMIHLSDKKTERYLASISRDLGLQIDLHLSSLNGLCQECRNKN